MHGLPSRSMDSARNHKRNGMLNRRELSHEARMGVCFPACFTPLGSASGHFSSALHGVTARSREGNLQLGLSRSDFYCSRSCILCGSDFAHGVCDRGEDRQAGPFDTANNRWVERVRGRKIEVSPALGSVWISAPPSQTGLPDHPSERSEPKPGHTSFAPIPSPKLYSALTSPT
jgi:hypothetical protein